MVVLDFLTHISRGSRIVVNNYFASYKRIKKMTAFEYGITFTLRSNRISNCPVPSKNNENSDIVIVNHLYRTMNNVLLFFGKIVNK